MSLIIKLASRNYTEEVYYVSYKRTSIGQSAHMGVGNVEVPKISLSLSHPLMTAGAKKK